MAEEQTPVLDPPAPPAHPEPDPTADALRQMADGINALSGAVTDIAERSADQEERIAADVDQRLDAIAGQAQSSRRPEAPGSGPHIEVPDRFRSYGYADPTPGEVAWGQRTGMSSKELRDTVFRSNLEIAMLVFGGTVGRQTSQIGEVGIPADLRAAYQSVVFEGGGSRPWVTDGDGKPVRAMDAQETGFGLELIGVQYVTNLWEASTASSRTFARCP